MDACSDAARARFPAGLFQPPNGYRFGEEALLLAVFGAKFRPGAKNVADLGTGCGVALFGILLLLENARGLGLEREPELVNCAMKNAEMLGLPAEFLCVDLAGQNAIPKTYAGKYDLALANPPWRAEQGGRPSPDALRNNALRSSHGILADFLAAAHFLLRHKGTLCLILPAQGLVAAFEAARRAGLGARFLLPLKTAAPTGRCERVILGFKKGAKDDLEIPAPVLVQSIRNDSPSLPWPARTLRITESF